MSTIRLLAVWLALAIIMSANGVFREIVLKPRVGGRPADVLSAAIGIAVILLVTAFTFRPLVGASTARLLGTSVVLVGLTIGFEVAMGRTVDHKSWAELWGNYAIWRGRLWPLVLLVVGLSPFIWGRWAAIGSGPAS